VLITTTLYHPSTRYRLAIVLPLLVLSGVGFSWLSRLEPVRRKVAFSVMGLLTLGLVALHFQANGYNRAEFSLQLAMSAGIQGDRQAEIAYAEQAAQFAPNDRSVQHRAQTMIQAARARLPSP
jgi:hypothetical protein